MDVPKHSNQAILSPLLHPLSLLRARLSAGALHHRAAAASRNCCSVGTTDVALPPPSLPPRAASLVRITPPLP
ncbi:hypothetical protein Nepgr_013231 [Nepenthes gracilis]|uniref:Uncharacterized protein n=1 Tax=Nepenthes gracilis TaxID=150966 RepID=A0AAD3SH26_NEPGR|nr:hypothetical protein Nepgr_013231 [Nepenthes gracilis]